MLGVQFAAHLVQDEARRKHVSLVREVDWLVGLLLELELVHRLLRSLVQRSASSNRGLEIETVELLRTFAYLFAVEQRRSRLSFCEIVFRLRAFLVLKEVGQACSVALQALNLLGKGCLWRVLLCKTEVSNLELQLFFVNKNIFRPYVSVDKAFLVNVLQSLQHLLE